MLKVTRSDSQCIIPEPTAEAPWTMSAHHELTSAKPPDFSPSQSLAALIATSIGTLHTLPTTGECVSSDRFRLGENPPP